jgi:hypothetical protein
LALRFFTEHGGFVAGLTASRERRTLVVSSVGAETASEKDEEARIG